MANCFSDNLDKRYDRGIAKKLPLFHTRPSCRAVHRGEHCAHCVCVLCPFVSGTYLALAGWYVETPTFCDETDENIYCVHGGKNNRRACYGMKLFCLKHFTFIKPAFSAAMANSSSLVHTTMLNHNIITISQVPLLLFHQYFYHHYATSNLTTSTIMTFIITISQVSLLSLPSLFYQYTW